jgi:putative restriction endonuclease
VTGLAVPELLRASHIKPWAKCDSDAERLDVYNGLLLAPHLDALFDAGLVTFEDDGTMRFSNALEPAARAILRVDENARIARLHNSHRAYLQWHRSREFVQK